jgi:hypothetical protein
MEKRFPWPVLTSAGTISQPSSDVPSDADRQEDNQMMGAFNQLTEYFNYQPRSEDIKLEGTAAIDPSV